MKRLVVAAAIVDDLDSPTRVLAARRLNPPELLGQWEFPGGKVKPVEGGWEDTHAALQRELCEELSIDVVVGPEVVHPAGIWPIDDRYEMRLFLCLPLGEPTPLHDHDAVRWLGPEELDSLTWTTADAAAVDAVREALTGGG